MKYKCIFSDIDGTLLNSQHQITPKTKAKIKTLHEKNIPFILVSARMPQGMSYLQDELGIHDPMICYGGGLILDQNEIIYSKKIDASTVDQLIKLIQKESQVCATLYEDNDWIVNDINDPWVIQESQITGIIPSQQEQSHHGAHKILCMGESQDISQLEQKLISYFPHLQIYQSKPTYLEIMDGHVSKSKAVMKICEKYHIPLHQTVSFGDHYNDIDMLQTTQWGFAMANAPLGVFNQIHLHTLSHDQDGIVYALENIIGE